MPSLATARAVLVAALIARELGGGDRQANGDRWPRPPASGSPAATGHWLTPPGTARLVADRVAAGALDPGCATTGGCSRIGAGARPGRADQVQVIPSSPRCWCSRCSSLSHGRCCAARRSDCRRWSAP
ncbi:hypothetical protein HBB16_03480 [Pseudonocardia sp. MCCB 268]|nr:hypothetical protein [Pseudonocardia cytotoxica]